MNDKKLNTRVVVISGASKGLGKAMALALGEAFGAVHILK